MSLKIQEEKKQYPTFEDIQKALGRKTTYTSILRFTLMSLILAGQSLVDFGNS